MAPSRLLVLLLLVVVVVVLVGAPTDAQINVRACRAARHLLVTACQSVLYGSLPSARCCERVRRTPWQCICPVITPKIAALIDVNRAIRLVQGCGRRVPRHFKCGSLTLP